MSNGDQWRPQSTRTPTPRRAGAASLQGGVRPQPRVLGVPSSAGVPGVPGHPAGAAPRPMATGTVEPVEAPAIEPFPEAGFYPSVLVVGPSGHGKSEFVASLIDAGFNVLVVLAEPKGATYVRRKPDIVQVARHEWSYAERYDRTMRFADDLKAGKYRVSPPTSRFAGRPYDAIALDGLTEIGDYAEAKFEHMRAAARMKGAGGSMFDYYILIGNKLINLFRIIRDAAGIAAAEAGQPPIVVMATCVERLGKIGEGVNQRVEWMPQLPGQMAGANIERHFETILNCENAFNQQGQFEFCIWTQARPGRMGKSPPIFQPCEHGPGSWLDPGSGKIVGHPHGGIMFARLLCDPRSPYWREDMAKRFAGLWAG